MIHRACSRPDSPYCSFSLQATFLLGDRERRPLSTGSIVALTTPLSQLWWIHWLEWTSGCCWWSWGGFTRFFGGHRAPL